ncbi:hypothetical protein Tco_0020173 [Tanacetum coccineum]
MKINTPYREEVNMPGSLRWGGKVWSRGRSHIRKYGGFGGEGPGFQLGRMDDPNMTMEEYIKLEEEKARRSVEAEFLVIVIDDTFAPQDALLCKSQVSTFVNDEIDFRISFDESDDEDYAIICNKNLFSYKMISVNNLKTDSENDNEKSGIPSFLPPKPTISYVDDLDFFKDFKNEFPAIVYNDTQTSKSDYLTEQTLSPQHNNESDLNDETSLSEYDKVGQNVLYFNDLFPFNVIHPDDLKSDEDNDKNEIDIIQSSAGNLNIHRSNMLLETSRDKIDKIFNEESFVLELNVNIRHLWLRYHVEGYTEEIVHDFNQRLETIFGRHVNRVHILDFEGLTSDMRQGLAERMRMVYTKDDGQEMGGARRRSERLIPDKGDLSDYWVEISSGRDFLRGAPSYTYIRDSVQRLCHRLISYSIFRKGQAPEKVTATDLFYLRSMDRGAANVPYLLAHYLFRHAEGRKNGARLSRGYFIGRLTHHFGLVSDDELRGLFVVARELPLIDMAGAPTVAEDAPAVDEGDHAVPAPMQAPQQPPPPPLYAVRTMPI